MFKGFFSNHYIKSSLAISLFTFAPYNAQAMVITGVFAPDVTAAEQSAFNYAAQQIDGLISNNLKFKINVDTMTSGLGQSAVNIVTTYNNGFLPISYSSFSNQINNNLTNLGLTSALLPSTTSLPDTTVYGMSTADAYALGFLTQFGSSSVNIGTFSFNANLSYTTSPTDQAEPGAYDLIGIAEHEITEILGRISGIENTSPFITPIDLFRYTGANQQVFNNTSGDYFSLDQGVTALQYFNTDTSQDIQDWNNSGNNPLNNPADAVNSSINSNQATGITNADLLSLAAIGYTVVVPLPASVWLFASAGLAMIGLSRRRAG